MVFFISRLHHWGFSESNQWHNVFHDHAEPNSHLLREVSTGTWCTSSWCLLWVYDQKNNCLCLTRISYLSSQGNQTELCKNCKSTYKQLNVLYGRMENNNSLCMDIEDSVSILEDSLRWEEGNPLPLEESVNISRQVVRGVFIQFKLVTRWCGHEVRKCMSHPMIVLLIWKLEGSPMTLYWAGARESYKLF